MFCGKLVIITIQPLWARW